MTSTAHEIKQSQPVPGRVYLCQISPSVSCGACCGLYNVADASADNLEAILNHRTTAFAAVKRTADDILNFQNSIASIEDQKRPYRDFHHCAFIGLIGGSRSRVGCLLHPEADGNNGIDFRGLSWYGGMACRSYFCPTHRQLPSRHKVAVREAAPNWHLYGLIITEVNMLSCFLTAVENHLGRKLQRGDVLNHPGWREALHGFFQLKINWPFRSSGSPGPANYFFEDGQHICPPVKYSGGGAGSSPYDKIFRSLHSRFESQNALQEAEDCIEKLLLPFSTFSEDTHL